MNISESATMTLPPPPPKFPWYAIRVRSNFEHATVTSLTGKGLDPFLPTYVVQRGYGASKQEVRKPLFPGYAFCSFNVNDRLPVLVCPGVVSIVSFAGVPAPVDENEIEAIRRIANSGIKTFPWPFLSVGHRVSIERGPLKGLSGIVVEVKNRFRMVASVSLLQRSVSVELEREWVRPLQNFKLACA